MNAPQDRTKNQRSGQALTEYVLITSLCMLVVLGVMAVFLGYVGSFYLNLLKIVCLPLP